MTAVILIQCHGTVMAVHQEVLTSASHILITQLQDLIGQIVRAGNTRPGVVTIQSHPVLTIKNK